jgi:hypothetical protein
METDPNNRVNGENEIEYCLRRAHEERNLSILATKKSTYLRHAMMADWFLLHADSICPPGSNGPGQKSIDEVQNTILLQNR